MQQSVSAQPAGGFVGNKTSAEEWSKAQEDAGAAFRQQRQQQFSNYRRREKEAAQRKAQKEARAKMSEEKRAEEKERQAAVKKAKQDETLRLRLQIKKQHSAEQWAKRQEGVAFRAQVEKNQTEKQSAVELEQAKLRKQVAGKTHKLIRLNIVDSIGNKTLQFPNAAQMSVVMSTAGKRLGFDPHHMRFLHDGKSLVATDSLLTVGLKDNDTINVVPLE